MKAVRWTFSLGRGFFLLLGACIFIGCPTPRSDSGGPPEEEDLPLFTNFLLPVVWALAVDEWDGKWIGTTTGGVYYLDDNGTPKSKTDDTWVTFTTSDGLASNCVRAIGIDASGGKWFGTYASDGGVSYLDDNDTPANKSDDAWATFKKADGLVDNWIYTMAIDASGGKWFGTAKGVSYLDDNETPLLKSDDSWTTFTFGTVDLNWVWAIAFDSLGRKWLGTAGGLIYLDDNGTPGNGADDTRTIFTTADGLDTQYLQVIAIDSSGGKWIGTTNGAGACYFDDGDTPTDKGDDSWTLFGISDGLGSNNVYAIAIDTAGGKWLVNNYGWLNHLDDGGTPTDKSDDQWTRYSAYDHLDASALSAIGLDGSNGKWIGTDAGVSYLP